MEKERKEMIQRAIGIACLLSLLACGSSPSVGSGESLSTLSSHPDGRTLAQAFLTAVLRDATSRSDRTAEETVPAGDGTSRKKSYRWDCLGGGAGEGVIVSNDLSDGVRIDAAFRQCGVRLDLDGRSLAEAISGDFHLESTNTRGSVALGFTVSGDLGLAIECEIEASSDEATDRFVYDGGCTFRDRAGVSIRMDGSDVRNLRWYD